MTKKTFNIANLFNARNDDKCLEQVLEETLAEQTLDQQDVVDIIETASNNYRKLHAFYIRRKDAFLAQANAPRGWLPGQSYPERGPFGYCTPFPNTFGVAGRQPDIELDAISSDDHPELFELLFSLCEFEISYNNTLLTNNFKFLGVDVGKGLTYLGRDKELATVSGSARYYNCQLMVRLTCQDQFAQIGITLTPASRAQLEQAIYKYEIVLPGQKNLNPSTRELIEHMRTQAWRRLTRGDLVTRIDSSEEPVQVYLLGDIEHYREHVGTASTATVMPVQILMDNKEVTAKPLGGGIQKVDLMLLKPWSPKG